ncbi:hypothetical protein HQ520_10325 [bacterium]|nr:hypothetical protein [bacterium]
MTLHTQNWSEAPLASTPPSFENLLAVLRREVPSRPTLFEFFLNRPLYQKVARMTVGEAPDALALANLYITAYRNVGYDYATQLIPKFNFSVGEIHRAKTYSINEGGVISDRASFDAYSWPDPDAANYQILDDLKEILPEGMKIIVHSPGGVLENAIRVVGYETLCVLIALDEQLVFDIFEAIGSRLIRYYERCLEHETVGAIIGNDDWGFKSQTMLSPADMRRFVFPWHKEIVARAHGAGRPAILHSCGCLFSVMDDIVDDIQYDGKHSYEDTIQPVEQAWEKYHDRIAIMGGMDVDFVCRHEPEAVYERAKAMLEKSAPSGAYALGTGNSVPEYVPDPQYFAMIRAALDMR